jgi:hypothetical protein
MRYIIYPYKMSSVSSRRLAEALREVGHKVLRVYPNRRYRPQPDDIIINWGNSSQPDWEAPTLNDPYNVGTATHKAETFYQLGAYNVPTPTYTLIKAEALIWLEQGYKVIARTLLTGHSGQGIVVMNTPEDFIEAPLYTKYFPKTHEYRVHIFRGDVLDITEKRRRNGAGGRESPVVWNHGNEYVYCRQGVACPEDVLDASRKAVEALGLDFGAVDVGYYQPENKVAVFEVNTAPGLVGTTLNKYVEKLNDISNW